MTSPIKHHPDAATLMSFAAGSLSEPLAATVAAHLSLCEGCRAEVRDMERIGAAILAALPGAAGQPRVPPKPRTRSPESPQPNSTATRLRQSERLPAPIAEHYGLAFESIPWKRLAPGVWHHRLALSPNATGDLRLLKIAAGCKMPDHGHGGEELTLVLDGAYRDETGAYGPGDIQDVDSEIEHSPIADSQMGCICLIASEQPARFKGLIGRLMQPWTGM